MPPELVSVILANEQPSRHVDWPFKKFVFDGNVIYKMKFVGCGTIVENSKLYYVVFPVIESALLISTLKLFTNGFVT